MACNGGSNLKRIVQLRPDTAPLRYKAASYSPSCKFPGCNPLDKLLLKRQVLFRLQAALQGCKLLNKATSYSSNSKRSSGCKLLLKASSYSSRL